MKRKLEAQSLEDAPSAEENQPLNFTKQLRSQSSRRRRQHISPIIQFSASDSHLTEASEVSCDSSVVSVSDTKQKEFGNQFDRVVTRSYYRKKYNDKSRKCDEDLSDNSCVELCSVANREFEKLKGTADDVEEKSETEITRSEVSTGNDDVRKVDSVEFEVSSEQLTSPEVEKDNSVTNDSVSFNSVEKTVKISEHKAQLDFDLACSEQFSNSVFISDGEEVEQKYSSGYFQIISDSEYTQSIWSYASGSEFSEKSMEDERSSPTFELFRQFRQLFCGSTFVAKACHDYSSDHEIALLGLEDEEDEESYRMLRKRERRRFYVRDYAEEYLHNTDFGDLVIQQRSQMVHWIVVQATNRELQKETMFLGVGLLDRFLSKGYFKNKRSLQIAGIACLTLATRIEENQPYNCVRRKTFHVENNTYARCEVVAMEWLVQEVLNFQCYLPTLHNFLWFFLKAARANEKVEKTAKYLAVLTLMDQQHLCYWPSTIAAALVILASLAQNEDASCHLITAIHARENDKDLPECIKSLEWLAEYLYN